jgi:hypothetical protein
MTTRDRFLSLSSVVSKPASSVELVHIVFDRLLEFFDVVVVVVVVWLRFDEPIDEL